MTSWLEPLGRGAPSRPERRPRMAGWGGGSRDGTVNRLYGQVAGTGESPVSVAPSRFSAIFAAMNAAIVRLDTPLEADVSVPGADRLLAGAPEHRVWNYFTDTTQMFFAGRWSGTRGKWRVRYTENELCVMTAGRVVITSDTGESSAFGPGDAFVVPAGFSGSWEVLEDCAKVYAIFEPRT
jgi:uncharacterized protein